MTTGPAVLCNSDTFCWDYYKFTTIQEKEDSCCMMRKVAREGTDNLSIITNNALAKDGYPTKEQTAAKFCVKDFRWIYDA